MFVESTENTEISAVVSLLQMLNDLSLYCRCDPTRVTENVTPTWTRSCWTWKNLNVCLWGNGHFHLKELEVVITKPLQSSKPGQLCSYTAVYLWLLDEARGAFWPKLASPWLVPAPSLTDPLEATGWALAVLASMVDDLGGCQILEVTYWGARAVPAGLGNRDYTVFVNEAFPR